jgi:hypothetical protein
MNELNFAPDGALFVSTETIIAHLRTIRDKRIHELLKHDDALMDLLEELYNTVAISPVKREFMKRDLAELKGSTLDLVHYSTLITDIKKNPESIDPQGNPLFTEELKKIFKKYGL